MKYYIMNNKNEYFSSTKEKYRGTVWITSPHKAQIIADKETARKIVNEYNLKGVFIVYLKPVTVEVH